MSKKENNNFLTDDTVFYVNVELEELEYWDKNKPFPINKFANLLFSKNSNNKKKFKNFIKSVQTNVNTQ